MTGSLRPGPGEGFARPANPRQYNRRPASPGAEKPPRGHLSLGSQLLAVIRAGTGVACLGLTDVLPVAAQAGVPDCSLLLKALPSEGTPHSVSQLSNTWAPVPMARPRPRPPHSQPQSGPLHAAVGPPHRPERGLHRQKVLSLLVTWTGYSHALGSMDSVTSSESSQRAPVL